jgi:DNA-binding transcriptional ArsR family regulator
MPSPPVLDRTFAALADPTRRAILERLSDADRLTVSDLASPFAMSLPAVLKHVGVLTEAGLVAREKVGRVVYCKLETSPLRDALKWLALYDLLFSVRPEATGRTVQAAGDKQANVAKRASRGRKAAIKLRVPAPGQEATAKKGTKVAVPASKPRQSRAALATLRRRGPKRGRGRSSRR